MLRSVVVMAVVARHSRRVGVRGLASAAADARAPRQMPLRRVLFNVPGSDQRKIDKALTSLDLDTLVLDLEDGVAANMKADARERVRSTLLARAPGLQPLATGRRPELLVRINSIGSGLEADDLRVMADTVRNAGALDAIVVPKVESLEHLEIVAAALDGVEAAADRGRVRLLAAIESARGMLDLRSICTHPRLDALIFASEDYCADTGMTRTPHARELLYARSRLVMYACAHNLQAIDMVHINFKDTDALTVEAREGADMGFTGKQAIHPAQVPFIYAAFAPSPQVQHKAERIKKEFEAAIEAGRGAFSLDGIMIDKPMYLWALNVLRRVPPSTS